MERAVETPSGEVPRSRTSCAMAPLSRAAQMVAASVIDQPWLTEGMTVAGLNTPKAAATTSPGTCPITEPRLVK